MAGPREGAPGERLRALVVDDDRAAADDLRRLLARDPRTGPIATAHTGPDALRALTATPIDVVFCDIQIPGLDGLDLARVVGQFARRPQIVFVTASHLHALDAFDVGATDYLVKPVTPARLAEAVTKASARANPPPSPTPPAGDEAIPVELAGVTTFVHRSDVLYVQAQGDYARLHTPTGSHLVRTSLTLLEQRWGAHGFVRIHRSTLVALSAITHMRVECGRRIVTLGAVDLQVSRRHSRELRERLLRRHDLTAAVAGPV